MGWRNELAGEFIWDSSYSPCVATTCGVSTVCPTLAKQCTWNLRIARAYVHDYLIPKHSIDRVYYYEKLCM